MEPDVASSEARWQAAWRDGNAFAAPPPEDGHPSVLISAGPNSLLGPLTVEQARHYILADFHARFRRMYGDAVLFSLGFETGAPRNGVEPTENAEDRTRQLDSLGLSVDWSRSFATREEASQRWTQRMFLALLEAGMVRREQGPMRWCENCRTLLPENGGEGEKCRLCEGPTRRMPAGQWYLSLDANAKTEGEAPAGPLSRAMSATAAVDFLGRTEGSEIEVKAMNGVALTVFTPVPKRLEEARFVAVSPHHPSLEALIQDPGLNERIAALRAGKPGTEKGKLTYPAITDTGAWVQVPPIDDPLPLIVSLAADARFGVAAFLGIPSADPLDAEVVDRLPSAPSLRWNTRTKPSKPRPAVRFRAHSLPLSNPDPQATGTPIPLVACAECGSSPPPLDALPVAPGSEAICPKCGKPARWEEGVLDSRVADWAEMLIAVPPEDRASAGPEHPEIGRWLPAARSLHSAESSRALLGDLVLLEALRDLNLVDLAPNGEAGAHDVITGGLEGDEGPGAGLEAPGKLAERFGVDALRFGLLHAAAPPKRFKSGELEGLLVASARFLERLRAYAEPRLSAPLEASPNAPEPAGETAAETPDRLRRRLAKWCRIALRKVTENDERLDAHRATRNVAALLTRIEDFEERAREERGQLSADDEGAIRAALCLLIVLLAPIAPHLSEELWERAGNSGWVSQASWPERFEPSWS